MFGSHPLGNLLESLAQNMNEAQDSPAFIECVVTTAPPPTIVTGRGINGIGAMGLPFFSNSRPIAVNRVRTSMPQYRPLPSYSRPGLTIEEVNDEDDNQNRQLFPIPHQKAPSDLYDRLDEPEISDLPILRETEKPASLALPFQQDAEPPAKQRKGLLKASSLLEQEKQIEPSLFNEDQDQDTIYKKWGDKQSKLLLLSIPEVYEAFEDHFTKVLK